MRRRRYDRGSATVELAVSLPALLLLLCVALGAVLAVRTQLECLDAARDGALAAARGDDGVAAASRRAPAGASVVVGGDGSTVRVTVAAEVQPLGGLAGFEVTGTAVAAREPGT
jgi:Flp pilus assembly protein TadG